MDGRLRTIDVIHVFSSLVDVIDHAGNRLLVSGNNSGGDDNRIVRLDLDTLVIIHGQSRQSGQRLSLASRHQQGDSIGREPLNLLRLHQNAVRDFEKTQVAGNLNIVQHTATRQNNLTIVLL